LSRVKSIPNEFNEKNVNWEAWACQLFFGYPLAEQSHFSEHSNNEQINYHSVEAVSLNRSSPVITDFTEAVSNSVELLQESVERSLAVHDNSKPVVFLSGGWDSRALVCALKNVAPKADIKAYTTSYDSGNNQEEVFASEVAKALNIPHEVIGLTKDYYKKDSHKAIELAGFSTAQHIWMENFLSQVRLESDAVNFDGYAGDILFRGMRQEVGDEKLSPDDPSFFKRLAVLRPQSVLTAPVFKTLEKLAKNALTKELSRYPGETRMLNFLLNNRGRRGIAHSIGLQRKYINVALPFMEERLLNYTANLDPNIRLDSRFYPALLHKLNAKVAILPSTNCTNIGHDKVKEVPQIKYSESNLSFIMNDLKKVANKHNGVAKIVDWYTITPDRVANKEKSGRDLAQHLRALENLHVYALWYEQYEKELNLKQNIMLDSYTRVTETLSCASLGKSSAHKEGFELIKREYLEKIQNLNAKGKLYFNFTMDVEAFGIGDYYSNHTASTNLIEKLVYSDFGKGSNIQRFILDRQIPCTYFIEAYSDAWESEADFAEVVSFFENEYSEIGLHCHAFSIPRLLEEELGLDSDWVFKPIQYQKVIDWGKRRLESALTRKYPLNSFRSGRLDIYPNFESGLVNCGFKIDSSFIDGIDVHHYEKRNLNIGNGIYEFKEVTEIPITSFRVGKRVTSLNFNSSSFENICNVVYQAIQDDLPCLTMLMHSWSFGKITEYSELGKKFHVSTDSLLIEKLNCLIEFISEIPCIELSTLSNAAEQLKNIPNSCHPASNLNTKPELLEVDIKVCGNSILVKAAPLNIRLKGDLLFAFYLMSNGEKIQTRMYEKSNEVKFELPNNFDSSNELVVRSFIKHHGGKEAFYKKSTSV